MLDRDGLKRLLGWLLITLIAAPLLFGIIWSVGLASALTSPVLLSDVPRKVISEAPELIDFAFEEAQRSEAIPDENVRAWIEAIADVDTTPSEILEEIGIFSWAREDLSESLEEMGEILRGNKQSSSVVLNTKGLKEAVNDPKAEAYYKEVVSNLRDCRSFERDSWSKLVFATGGDVEELPACNPGDEVTNEVVDEAKKEISRINDEVAVSQNFLIPTQDKLVKTVIRTTSVLFILPTLVMFLGVLLISRFWKTRLAIIGLTAFATSTVVYIIAYISKQSAFLGVNINPNWTTYSEDSLWSQEFQNYIVSTFGDTIKNTFTLIFDPVMDVATYIIALGLFIVGLSFFLGKPRPLENVVIYDNSTAVKKSRNRVVKEHTKTEKKKGRPKKVVK